MMNILSGGTAEEIAFISAATLGASSDRLEVTAFGDANKVYVAGLPDATGTFSGFYDNATAQTFQAALDGVARKMYLYPDRTNSGQYWFGTVFVDFNLDMSVGGAAAISGTWSAASNVSKVG